MKLVEALPTRWGTQLNGNCNHLPGDMNNSHKSLPTRWGTQLNGNPQMETSQMVCTESCLPTRWGTQLNGNFRDFPGYFYPLEWFLAPHSLGNPIKWKPECQPRILAGNKKLPTRWGTQLNGNERSPLPLINRI